MLFHDDSFVIEPNEGTLWPNGSVEIKCMFKPSVPGIHEKMVFCDVTGRETRLPLRLTV